MNAKLECKCNKQRILTPGYLNWVQHCVSRMGPFSSQITIDRIKGPIVHYVLGGGGGGGGGWFLRGG